MTELYQVLLSWWYYIVVMVILYSCHDTHLQSLYAAGAGYPVISELHFSFLLGRCMTYVDLFSNMNCTFIAFYQWFLLWLVVLCTTYTRYLLHRYVRVNAHTGTKNSLKLSGKLWEILGYSILLEYLCLWDRVRCVVNLWSELVLGVWLMFGLRLWLMFGLSSC